MKYDLPGIRWSSVKSGSALWSIDTIPNSTNHRFFTAADENLVHLWSYDTSNGKVDYVESLEGFDKPVNVIRVHPSGKQVACGCVDGKVMIFVQQPDQTWQRHSVLRCDSQVFDLAWSGSLPLPSCLREDSAYKFKDVNVMPDNSTPKHQSKCTLLSAQTPYRPRRSPHRQITPKNHRNTPKSHIHNDENTPGSECTPGDMASPMGTPSDKSPTSCVPVESVENIVTPVNRDIMTPTNRDIMIPLNRDTVPNPNGRSSDSSKRTPRSSPLSESSMFLVVGLEDDCAVITDVVESKVVHRLVGHNNIVNGVVWGNLKIGSNSAVISDMSAMAAGNDLSAKPRSYQPIIITLSTDQTTKIWVVRYMPGSSTAKKVRSLYVKLHSSLRLFRPLTVTPNMGTYKCTLPPMEDSKENMKLFLPESAVQTFFRRPSSSYCGTLVAIPCGQVGGLFAVTIWAPLFCGTNPLLSLISTPKSASSTVRFAPFNITDECFEDLANEIDGSANVPLSITFEDDTCHSVLAVGFQDGSIEVWVLGISVPIVVILKAHCQAITDISWFSNPPVLFASSSDGYVSVISLPELESCPYHHEFGVWSDPGIELTNDHNDSIVDLIPRSISINQHLET